MTWVRAVTDQRSRRCQPTDEPEGHVTPPRSAIVRATRRMRCTPESAEEAGSQSVLEHPGTHSRERCDDIEQRSREIGVATDARSQASSRAVATRAATGALASLGGRPITDAASGAVTRTRRSNRSRRVRTAASCTAAGDQRAPAPTPPPARTAVGGPDRRSGTGTTAWPGPATPGPPPPRLASAVRRAPRWETRICS